MTMRRITILLACLCPLMAASQYRIPSVSELTDSETVSALKDHVSYLCSPALAGRAAGSDGEAEAAAYMADAFKTYGADLISAEDVFGLKQDSGDTLTSRNVVAFVPGFDKRLKDHYIVVGARLDGLPPREITVDGQKREVYFPGANAGASGAAMLLELARKLVTGQVLLGRSVLLVGFGASQQTFAGAWYWLNRSFPDTANIDAMVDLEALGMGNSGFYAFCASNPDLTELLGAVGATLQPVKPEISAAQIFPSDQMAFYDKKIPSVMFTTGHFKEFLTPMDTPEKLDYEWMEQALEYLFNFTVRLSNAPRPVFDVAEELRSRKSEDAAVVPYYDCDYRPAFMNNTDPKVFLQKWVYQYLKYPQSAVREGVQGKVLVDFIIDEKGKVRDVQVLRGVDPRLDEEAVRVVSASPDWRPGYVGGKKVKAEMSLWIEFRLEKKKNKK